MRNKNPLKQHFTLCESACLIASTTSGGPYNVYHVTSKSATSVESTSGLDK